MLNSIKGRISFGILVVLIIVSVVMSINSYNKAKNSILTQAKEDANRFYNLFEHSVKAKAKDVSIAMELVVNDMQAVEYFANKDRESLKNHFLEVYKNKLKPVYKIKQFQYHVPPATSFLRLHKPSKFGDDLSAFRKTVIEVNKNQKKIVGLEVGRGGPGLRVVYPVFDADKNFLGSVDIQAGL